MKKFSVLALGVVVGLSGVSAMDAAVKYGQGNDRGRGDRVCVYKDINYQGAEQCYSAGDEVTNLGVQRKSISSVRVFGRGTVTVFENTAFRGHSAQFTSDVSDLGQRMMTGNTSWSDHIDSLRIGFDSAFDGNDRRNGEFRRDQSQQPRDGICVYDRPNYEGRSRCWNQGQNISDLSLQDDWSGQISSIRLLGRTVAMVYQNTNFRGGRLTVDRDIPDLAAIRGTGNGNGRDRNGRNFRNWNRQIHSLQVQAQRLYR